MPHSMKWSSVYANRMTFDSSGFSKRNKDPAFIEYVQNERIAYFPVKDKTAALMHAYQRDSAQCVRCMHVG